MRNLRKDLTSQVEKLKTDIQALQMTMQDRDEQIRLFTQSLMLKIEEAQNKILPALKQIQDSYFMGAEPAVLLDTMTQLRDALENEKTETWKVIRDNHRRLDKLSAEIEKFKAAQD